MEGGRSPQEEERTFGEWVSDSWGCLISAVRQAIARNPSAPPAPRYLRGSLTIFTSLIAIAIAASLYYALRDVFAPVLHSPAPVSPVPTEPEKGGLLTREESAAAHAVVAGFLAAPTVREKLSFVRHPARVESEMGEFYRSPQGSLSFLPQTPGPTLRASKTLFGDCETIVIAMNVPAGGSPRIFLVEKVNGSTYRLDWESSSGFQEMPLEEFKAALPEQPVPFRVHVTRDDYYNYGFSENTHQSYRLTYPLDPEFELFGYVLRGSEAADDMARAYPEIASGEPAGAILNLSYPKTASPASDKFVNVDAVVLDHWMAP